MKARCIENIPYDELDVGSTASVSHVLTRRDIQLFAVMSGDVNPAHMDERYAENSSFHHIIGHGMWSASLISTVLGTQLPGAGTIYLEQDLQFLHPVSLGDEVTASVTVVSKDARHRITLDCLCVNQDGTEVVKGQATVIAPAEKIRYTPVSLPVVELYDERPPLYDQLIAMEKGLEPLKTAIVHPCDALSLQGAIEGAKHGLIEPVLVGPADKIKAVAEAEGYDISAFELISTPHSNAAAEAAVQLARDGAVEAVMKGKIHTDELMEAVVSRDHGLRTGKRMSHVFVLDIKDFPRPLFLTDAALNIVPGLMDKKHIVQNAIDLFNALGMGIPKVAILSAVETVEEKIPSTLDATALCKMAERGQITGGVLDGPLAFDNAISEEAARTKGIISQVAGKADILVMPDLVSGNMLYKQMRYLSKAEGAGIVLGARVPVILTSRASGPVTRMASCALALVYTRRQQAELQRTESGK